MCLDQKPSPNETRRRQEATRPPYLEPWPNLGAECDMWVCHPPSCHCRLRLSCKTAWPKVLRVQKRHWNPLGAFPVNAWDKATPGRAPKPFDQWATKCHVEYFIGQCCQGQFHTTMEMVASLSLSLLWISKARRVEHPSFLELPRDITGYRHPRVEAGDACLECCI